MTSLTQRWGPNPHATEIRIRAARKAGELLKVMAETGERHNASDGRPGKVSGAPTLSDLGVTPNQSSRWQACEQNIPRRDVCSAKPLPRGRLSDLGVTYKQSSRWQAI